MCNLECSTKIWSHFKPINIHILPCTIFSNDTRYFSNEVNIINFCDQSNKVIVMLSHDKERNSNDAHLAIMNEDVINTRLFYALSKIDYVHNNLRLFMHVILLQLLF